MHARHGGIRAGCRSALIALTKDVSRSRKLSIPLTGPAVLTTMASERWCPVPSWFFLISGLICGLTGSWLLAWQRRIRRRAIAAGVRLGGTVLAIKPSRAVGQWPNSAVASPRLVVRWIWQGAAREGEVVLRTVRPAREYHPGQVVDLAVDRTRPDRVVLVDGGGQSISIEDAAAMIAGILLAAIAAALLIRFLIAIF